MPKVVNVKTRVVDIKEKFKKTKIGDKLDRIKKELGIDILASIPPSKYNIVEFEIKNTNAAFANAIRRTLVSEFPVWSLEMDEDSYESDDHTLKSDELATSIASLPIIQEYFNKMNKGEKITNVKCKINIKNKLPQRKNIYSDEIEITGYTGKDSFLIPNISLGSLGTNNYLNVKLSIVRGYGYIDGAKFSATPNINYIILDHEPLQVRYKAPPLGKSSLESNPKEFYFKYHTYIYMDDPLYFILITLQEIKERVKKVLDQILYYESTNKNDMQDVSKDLHGKLIMYQNEIIEIRKESDTYFITIKDESTTISKLYTKYISENNPNIAEVNDSCIHPLERVVRIKIQDTDAIKLMINNGKKIITDLESVIDQIKKV
jgi:DNA-directed RNA polymerase subunit L